MTSRDFVYWLQGYFEISEITALSPHQVAIIQRHLSLVFKHEIDPSMGDAGTQATLNQLHGPQALPPIVDGVLVRC